MISTEIIPMEPIFQPQFRQHHPRLLQNLLGKGKYSNTCICRHCFSSSYVISKIPKSNLMMIYVNHSKEISQLCEKLIIKRKPVKFTQDDVCTRLKTTPYRERPHKCFFVHDDERDLFEKCSNAIRLVNSSLFSYILSIVILFYYHLRTY